MSQTDETTEHGQADHPDDCSCVFTQPHPSDCICGGTGERPCDEYEPQGEPSSPPACNASSPVMSDTCNMIEGHKGPHRSLNGNAWGFPSVTPMGEAVVCGRQSDVTREHGAPCTREPGHPGMHWAKSPSLVLRVEKHEEEDPGLCGATNEITPFTCVREHGHGGLHQGANDQTWSIDFRELYPPSAATPPVLGPENAPEPAAERCESVSVTLGRRCTKPRGHEGWHESGRDHQWLEGSRSIEGAPTDPIRHEGCLRMLEAERRQRAALQADIEPLTRTLAQVRRDMQGMQDAAESAHAIVAQREDMRKDLLELCQRIFDLERVWSNEGYGGDEFADALNNVIGLAHDHAKPVELEDDLAAEIAKHVTDDLAPGGAPRCHECGEHVPCLVMKLDQERRELKETLDEHLKRGEG